MMWVLSVLSGVKPVLEEEAAELIVVKQQQYLFALEANGWRDAPSFVSKKRQAFVVIMNYCCEAKCVDYC